MGLNTSVQTNLTKRGFRRIFLIEADTKVFCDPYTIKKKKNHGYNFCFCVFGIFHMLRLSGQIYIKGNMVKIGKITIFFLSHIFTMKIIR